MNRTCTTVFCTALFLVAGVFSTNHAFGQAIPTATRNLPPFSVYGGYSSIDSDYGNKNQAGYFAGAAYTRNFSRIYVVPSLELRASISPMGQNVAENTYQVGFKAEHEYFRRLHPSAEFLIGTGTIRYRAGIFGPNEKSDNSVVPSYGGGIDVDIIQNFAVKVDYLQSHWHTGGTVTYTPSGFNFGVLYHLPFGQK